jgi:hypothetical protein
MIGVGSDNARGSYDNIRVQILPPQVTLEETEDFDDGVADLFTGDRSGTWVVNAGHYDATPNGNLGVNMLDLGPDNLNFNSYLELSAAVNTADQAGFIFDRYGDESFKYVSIDADNQQLVIGHYTQKSGWVVDEAVSTTIDPTKDYTLGLTLKGTTVSATLNDAGNGGFQAIAGHVFNAATVDGNFGLMALVGSTSFDDVIIKTDDPAFRTPDDIQSMTASSAQVDPAEQLSDLTYEVLDPILAAAIDRWSESTLFDEAMLGQLEGVNFLIADLEGDTLALTVDDTVIIDVDAAEHGWFIDDTPYQDTEFVPQNNDEVLTANESSDAYGDMDLLTVVMHELGHVFGFQDMDPATNDAEIMNETLDEGVRYLPEGTFTGQTQGPAEPLISMDLTPDETTAQDHLDTLVNANPWLVNFLVDGASDDTDSNSDIVVVIDEDNADSGTAPAAPPPSENGNGKKK